MKNFFFVLFLLPLGLFAQKSFTITGKTEGFKDSTPVKILNMQDQSVVASAIILNNGFAINGQLAEPALFLLALGDVTPQQVYLENSPITITASRANISNIRVEGSVSHTEFDGFRRIFAPLMDQLNGVVTQMNQQQDEKKRESLVPFYDSLRRKVSTEIGRFISTHPKSYVAPFILFVTGQVTDDFVEMDKRYNSLDSNVRKTQIGQSLSQYIAYNKVGAIGSEAIEFVQTDTSGKPVSLSAFRGKYVLLDFWASWCKPCRLENPNVVKAYKKFGSKNFTILGISLDKEKQPWLQAIKTDGLSWTHLSDLQAWSNAAAQLYHVQGIPQNFLIDPNGKIVGKNLRGAELESKLCELLGCN